MSHRPTWSVSVPSGALSTTIGQGTSSFTVEIDELEGQSITATVEVGGYDPKCPKSASISVTVATHPDQTLITGVVKERNGPNLSGASVKATKRQSSFSASDTTNADGKYILKPLETGKYQVTASKDGYRSQTKSVELKDAGDQVELNFELKKR
ncbi:MAG: carboxypeptidase regulatory-like domain-containing protein [Rubrivivax sp.]|nr:carboxypeptidase regulatory-like domain-containing protein [Pyrinomonadaceae bacterium]